MTAISHKGHNLATRAEVLHVTELPASIESVARNTGKCRATVRKHLEQLVKEGRVIEVRIGNCRIFRKVYYKGETPPDPETLGGIEPLTEESLVEECLHAGDE